MQVVAKVRTPQAFPGLRTLIEAAFEALGRRLSPLQAVNLTALAGIETARGSALYNHNLGNISAGKSYAGKAWRPPWFDDVTHPVHARMLAGLAPSAFRAYGSPEEGARDFARLLLGSAYANVMRAADQTSPDTFRVALSERYSPDYRDSRATETFRQLQRELGLVVSDTPTVLLAGLPLLALLWMLSHRRG